MVIAGSLQAEQLNCTVNAEAAILMNADTGVILFEKNAHDLHFPASITKIATASYALKNNGDKLDEVITVEQEAVASISEEKKRKNNYEASSYLLVPGGTHIGLKKGEEMSLIDLLYGMMLASGNDAANVIAQHIGGTIPAFVDNLNVYLKEIGCKNTTFLNPHGLHHPKHQTTAFDMAMMAKEALKDPVFRKIVATVRYPRPKTNKQESTTLVQTNRLLKKGKYFYAKAIGVKTGQTSLAGSTLVAAAKNGDRTLIAVMLKCKEREDTLKDATALFDAAFNQTKVKKVLLRKGPQTFAIDVPGAKNGIATMIPEDLSIEYYPAEEPKVKSFLTWAAVTPPVKQGQPVGEVYLQTEDGTKLNSIPLLAQDNVDSTWLWSFKETFKGGSSFLKWLGVIIALAFLGGLFLLLRRQS